MLYSTLWPMLLTPILWNICAQCINKLNNQIIAAIVVKWYISWLICYSPVRTGTLCTQRGHSGKVAQLCGPSTPQGWVAGTNNEILYPGKNGAYSCAVKNASNNFFQYSFNVLDFGVSAMTFRNLCDLTFLSFADWLITQPNIRRLSICPSVHQSFRRADTN